MPTAEREEDEDDVAVEDEPISESSETDEEAEAEADGEDEDEFESVAVCSLMLSLSSASLDNTVDAAGFKVADDGVDKGKDTGAESVTVVCGKAVAEGADNAGRDSSTSTPAAVDMDMLGEREGDEVGDASH